MIKKLFLGLALVYGLAMAGPGPALSLEPGHPDPRRIFNWSPTERFAGFRSMEKLTAVNVVNPGPTPSSLPEFKPQSVQEKQLAAKLEAITDKFMASGHVVGVLVIHKGVKFVEKYQHGLTPEDRWTSFSVAKSVTSTLTGAALKDGYIKSLDDLVTDYVPELKNTAYDGVSIRHLLSMTSGIAWNEDYSDPNSDTAKIALGISDPNLDIISLMSRMAREAEPGQKWAYKTGESNILGLVIQRAAQKSLAEYLGEKIWRPYGMERSAFWALDGQGHELGGCCLSMCLRDYGRFGLFVLNNGRLDGQEILPADWLAEATRDATGSGYGLHWWLPGNGAFMASGIFGQMIYIDPKTQTVVAALSAWPDPTHLKGRAGRHEYVIKIKKLLAQNII